jgi:hypothetical protein
MAESASWFPRRGRSNPPPELVTRGQMRFLEDRLAPDQLCPVVVPRPLGNVSIASCRNRDPRALSSYRESHGARSMGWGLGPRRAQQSNTDQQISFRNRWSSSTSSRIASGSWSRCH